MARPSYETIKKQIARLEAQAKAIEAARDGTKARSVERVRALMKKLGVEVADLASPVPPKGRRAAKAGAPGKAPAARAARKGARATVAPKYRDPESGTTWSGRGRTPVWLATQIAQGRSKGDFAIVEAAGAE